MNSGWFDCVAVGVSWLVAIRLKSEYLPRSKFGCKKLGYNGYYNSLVKHRENERKYAAEQSDTRILYATTNLVRLEKNV